MPLKDPYSIRPGIYADVPACARIYMRAFTDPRSEDNIIDAMFPGWRDNRPGMHRLVRWMFEYRYWVLEYRVSCVVDERSQDVVGFASWKRPDGDISWAERWLYPSTWLRYIAMYIQAFRYVLSRGPKIDTTALKAAVRVISRQESELLNTPRRRAAQYLSVIAIDPDLQGSGLGLALMEDGLAQCEAMDDDGQTTTAAAAAAAGCGSDEDGEEEDGEGARKKKKNKARGRATWLIARLGTEAFYERFGFGAVGRVNVGEFSDWNGGAVMVRE